MIHLGSCAQDLELPADGLAVSIQEECGPSLSDTRGKKQKKPMIDLAPVLSIVRIEGGFRELNLANPALESLDIAAIAEAVESPFFRDSSGNRTIKMSRLMLRAI